MSRLFPETPEETAEAIRRMEACEDAAQRREEAEGLLREAIPLFIKLVSDLEDHEDSGVKAEHSRCFMPKLFLDRLKAKGWIT